MDWENRITRLPNGDGRLLVDRYGMMPEATGPGTIVRWVGMNEFGKGRLSRPLGGDLPSALRAGSTREEGRYGEGRTCSFWG